MKSLSRDSRTKVYSCFGPSPDCCAHLLRYAVRASEKDKGMPLLRPAP